MKAIISLALFGLILVTCQAINIDDIVVVVSEEYPFEGREDELFSTLGLDLLGNWPMNHFDGYRDVNLFSLESFESDLFEDECSDSFEYENSDSFDEIGEMSYEPIVYTFGSGDGMVFLSY